MKLISLKLCNFRQFYGKTPEINLASGAKNTTIIHANNGGGKTTILNAFTWILYEKFTAAFASPELLVNKRAITETDFGVSVECWAEVIFEHESKHYQVKRHCYAYRDADDKVQYGQSKLFMLISGDDGKWYHPTQQPEDIIERILPSSLHQYFFFDGERIDHIFRYGEKTRIAEDTKELLGVKVLDRAIDHLKKAKKTLQDELKAIGDSETKKLLHEQTKLEQNREKINQKQEEIRADIQQQEEVKKLVKARLLELSGAEELQQLKTKLETQEQATRQTLIKAKDELKKIISSRGYTVFLPHFTIKFRNLIQNLRQQGQLPSGIKQQFVQELLNRQSCICGTPLIEGNDPHNQVTNWMEKAGIADVEETAIRMETQVTEIEKQFTAFWQEVDQKQALIQQKRSELGIIENELDDLNQKFRHLPNEDIKQLHQQLDNLESSLKSLILEQGANQQHLELINKEINDIDQKIIRNKAKEGKQALAQRRISITEEVIRRITEVRSRLEKQFRLSLEQKVQEIFSTISFTPYIPRLTVNYELTLIENTTGIAVPVAASTGENQILSLSFIGGIIDRVREWSQKNTLMGPDSSTFPIIMDSPFGSLDEIYRRQVAKSIPKLANQLVVLVTKTQWRGEVEEEMADHIGQEYVLVYYSPKPDCEEDFIERHGVLYPLVQRSVNGFEYTEILEVKIPE